MTSRRRKWQPLFPVEQGSDGRWGVRVNADLVIPADNETHAFAMAETMTAKTYDAANRENEIRSRPPGLYNAQGVRMVFHDD